jgi:phosphate transport system substrate-binding protein
VGSSGSRRIDRVQTSTLTIIAALVSGTIAGCGGGGGGTGAALKSTPTIVVDGSSTVVRISEAAQNGFNAIDPTVRVTVDEHGTGGGFANYLKNEVDIVDASREAKPDEEKKANEQGIPWTRFLVGYDGITLVINAENDFAKELSVDQLKATWAPGSKVKTWKDLDPSWPNNPIGLYSPDNDSGTFDYFTEAIVGKMKSQRDDVQQNSSDNSLVQGVAGDKFAMGYFGYPYYSSNKDKLRAVAIRNGKDAKAVLPSPETIRDKSYVPLSRPLYIYVKNSSARRSEVGRFVRYYLENIDELAKEGGYEPPSAQDKAANKEAIDHLLGGEAQASATAKK